MSPRLVCLAATVVLCAAADLPAGKDNPTAKNPLNPPLFSIDPLSPEVLDGPLLPGDLLLPGEPNFPEVVIPAEGMSLLDPNDDLDAFSFAPYEGCETTEFVLIFSVDREAMGGEPPDPVLLSMGFPFNVLDQALNNQAAGDAYMSLLLFTRMGAIPPPPGRPSHANNNTLVVNQGDAGGVHFALNPSGVPPGTAVPPGTPQSDADAGGGTQPPAPPPGGRGSPEKVLFSLTTDSPALLHLPGYGSGADVYVDHNPYVAGDEGLYVAPSELGLMLADDIDAMIVIDVAYNWQFDPGVDQIIFSLAPGSPSLDDWFGPGDLFTSSGNGIFAPYCYAEQLGLAWTDNLNLLDLVLCDDVLSCVEEWAIGYGYPCTGDLDGDGDVDLADLALLLSSYGLCEGDPGFVPEADLVEDGCIGLADLATLLAHYGETCW